MYLIGAGANHILAPPHTRCKSLLARSSHVRRLAPQSLWGAISSSLHRPIKSNRYLFPSYMPCIHFLRPHVSQILRLLSHDTPPFPSTVYRVRCAPNKVIVILHLIACVSPCIYAKLRGTSDPSVAAPPPESGPMLAHTLPSLPQCPRHRCALPRIFKLCCCWVGG